VKILFIARHFTYFRNFDSVIALLANRGHIVHLAADRDEVSGGRELVDRLAAQFPRVTVGVTPIHDFGRYTRVARALRLGLDYLRYSEPRYDAMPKLRQRAYERTPAFVLALARLPIRGMLRRLLERIEEAVPRHRGIDEFIREHRPDLLLVTPLIELGAPQLDYVRAARRLGVRSLFVNHWTNNALGGSALEGGAKGVFINIFNRFQTGRYFDTGECPHAGQGEEVTTLSPGELGVLVEFFPATRELAEEGMPAYPSGRQCNTKGLTKLGAYAIRRLIANRMLIEADHMSERARARVLRIAERHDYPLVSSHTGTGGAWTPRQLRRLRELGGFATVHPEQAPELADAVAELRRRGNGVAVGLGTDTGGFSSLPAPREDASSDPLAYPFRSYDGEVEFARQRSGERVFDLNSDGVAHYGLLADLLADTQRQPGGERALRLLSRSAEAYLRTWRRATRRR
jgi:hypothetical protein